MESDISTLKQQTTNLRKINEDFDQTIKCYGLMASDLQNVHEVQLGELINLKQSTGLVHVELSNLQEWYCTQMEEIFPRKLAISNLKNDSMDLDQAIFKQEQILQETKKFLDYIKKTVRSDTELKKLFEEKKRDLQHLFDKKNTVHAKDRDIFLDDIIQKIETLESKPK